jgi:hypothetical protein
LRTPELITAIYFSYALVLAVTLRLPARRRGQIAGLATVVNAAVIALAIALPSSWLRDLVPGLCLIAAYRLSGLFFVRPMEPLEQYLAAADRKLFEKFDVDALVSRAPRIGLEYLEGAYMMAAPLVGLAFFGFLLAGESDRLDRFWTLVLIVEYICFGMMPWLQTRPPWLLEGPAAISRRPILMRTVNAAMVDRVLMPVNTFPSGHAATALAVALSVMPLAPVAGAMLIGLALSVALGSIVGRYHYAVDAVLGIALTLVVWAGLRASGA